jgi:Glycosyl hydrolase family 57
MLAELEKNAKIEMALPENPLFGVLAHAYQPPRSFNVELTLEGREHRASFSVIPSINDKITGQVYKPILSEGEHLSPGLIVSIYAPLRSYLKINKPDIFAGIREAVRNTPDREYTVLGDPLVHVILPLLPSDDQQMLLGAGRRAFINDFGFAPKGLWLPETAVSKETLRNAKAVGYDFVPLREGQVTNFPIGTSLDAKHNVCVVKTDKNQEMVVLLGNKKLGDFVSFQPWSTYNAEGFMSGRQRIEQRNGENALMMMDLERYGHHQPGAEEFLKRALNIQESYGFSPINMRQVLEAKYWKREKTYVDIIDNTSWSCDHNLGRWTGQCNCDGASESTKLIKQGLYENLTKMNEFVNSSLDTEVPCWRKEFADLFVALSDDIFTGTNFGPSLDGAVKNSGGDEHRTKLFLAKIEIMVGMTSCGWFFGKFDSPERNIPSSMIRGVKNLLPEFK